MVGGKEGALKDVVSLPYLDLSSQSKKTSTFKIAPLPQLGIMNPGSCKFDLVYVALILMLALSIALHVKKEFKGLSVS